MVELESKGYDGIVESTDWRFSAAIVGLVNYLWYFRCDYDDQSDPDILQYHQSDLTEERYLEYVEKHYEDDMHHKFIEHVLEQEVFSEDSIKLVNVNALINCLQYPSFGCHISALTLVSIFIEIQDDFCHPVFQCCLFYSYFAFAHGSSTVHGSPPSDHE